MSWKQFSVRVSSWSLLTETGTQWLGQYFVSFEIPERSTWHVNCFFSKYALFMRRTNSCLAYKSSSAYSYTHDHKSSTRSIQCLCSYKIPFNNLCINTFACRSGYLLHYKECFSCASVERYLNLLWIIASITWPLKQIKVCPIWNWINLIHDTQTT